MTKDNKTKKDYISPMTLAARDIIDIKSQAANNMFSLKQDEVGIFEFIEDTYRKTYPRDLHSFIERVAKVRQGDFFVTVGSKVDPLLNLLWVKNGKLIITDSGSCPIPRLGTHVYHYRKKSGDYNLLWALPERKTLNFVKDNIIDLASDLKDLIAFIYQYEDGTLHRLRDTLNGVDPNKKEESRLIQLTPDKIDALRSIQELTIQTDTKYKDNKTKEVDGRHNEPNIG